jgi:hypothetical protein
MLRKLQTFDWQLFWLLEVIFLGAPTLVTIMAFRVDGTLPLHRAAILLVVLLGLTGFNLILFAAAPRSSGKRIPHVANRIEG